GGGGQGKCARGGDGGELQGGGRPVLVGEPAALEEIQDVVVDERIPGEAAVGDRRGEIPADPPREEHGDPSRGEPRRLRVEPPAEPERRSNGDERTAQAEGILRERGEPQAGAGGDQPPLPRATAGRRDRPKHKPG